MDDASLQRSLTTWTTSDPVGSDPRVRLTGNNTSFGCGNRYLPQRQLDEGQHPSECRSCPCWFVIHSRHTLATNGAHKRMTPMVMVLYVKVIYCFKYVFVVVFFLLIKLISNYENVLSYLLFVLLGSVQFDSNLIRNCIPMP